MQKYNERKLKFHDPKVKKKQLWTEIVKEFKIKKYYVDEYILDRKWRNMKKSYKAIVDSKKNVNTWEWYEYMKDIYKGDPVSSVTAVPNSVRDRVTSPLRSSPENIGRYLI